MERFAKKFRVMGSLCILFELVAAFLPFLKRIQENYADKTWSQIQYIQGILQTITKAEEQNLPEALTSGQIFWIVVFLVLPLLLALAAGVWGLVGDHTQKISLAMIFVVCLLEILMLATSGKIKPEAVQDQSYLLGYGAFCSLIFSILASVFAVTAWIATPKVLRAEEMAIPKLHEIKQEQIEAKYNVVLENQAVQDSKNHTEHGVLVGLKGIYAGAEITMQDQEELLLGRAEDNHLIFKGEKSISRRHCTIRWNKAGKNYILHDYSSNGTYLNGSKKALEKNKDIQLSCGSKVALGDQENVLLLR